MKKRTAAIAAAGAAALIAAAVILQPNANANPGGQSRPQVLSTEGAMKLGSALARDLGEGAAGWYLEDSAQGSRLVVNVLDEDSAESVESRGAVAEIVENSMGELEQARQELEARALIPGTAWSIDPKTNKVQVTADESVTGEDWETLEEVTGALGDKVSVKRAEGVFRLFDDNAEDPPDAGQGGAGDADDGADGGAEGADGGADGADEGADGGAGGGGGGKTADGGDAIFGGGSRCTLGFNVQIGGTPGFLTAGHCGNLAADWSLDAEGTQPLGTVVDTQFPGTDFAALTYVDANTLPSATVDLQDGTTQEIIQAADAVVGMPVQTVGSTTQVVQQGQVVNVGVTATFQNEDSVDTVDGLVETDICTQGGDSGGPLFSGSTALGLLSGGTAGCEPGTAGNSGFFQPVVAALQATGSELVAVGDAAGDAAGDGGVQ